MKKFLLTIGFASLIYSTAQSQNSIDKKEADFDKKFRFGIRVTGQPTWYKSGNTSSKANGAVFGYGFGLNMEFKLSNIIHFLTGIGGDFEGGKIAYRNDGSFAVQEMINNEGVLVEAKKGMAASDYFAKGNTSYILKDRKYSTTMITIPLLLKMMTQEYSGLRYFAIFGGELGIRAASKANDTFYSGYTSNGTLFPTAVAASDLSKNGILVGKDASLIPMRFGMNLGLGTEYRIAGSTSLVFSVNYFQSFTNLMRSDSKYLTKTETVNSDGSMTFSYLNQSYLMRAVRINISLMF